MRQGAGRPLGTAKGWVWTLTLIFSISSNCFRTPCGISSLFGRVDGALEDLLATGILGGENLMPVVKGDHQFLLVVAEGRDKAGDERGGAERGR